MITNQEDIDRYTEYNKIYIPNDYINQNWTYKINGDYITIITNQNCYNNYNTTYCDCRTYNYKRNLITDSFSCNTNNNNPTIPYSSITSDINYSEVIREYFVQEKITSLGIFILGIIIAILITKRGVYR